MKILAIPYSHTLSHISRPLLIAEELRKRGHEVVFAGESRNKTFIEQCGFPVLPLYEPDPSILFDNIRKGRLRFISDEVVKKMIEADSVLFKSVKPDIVLSDGRFSAPISTHIVDIPHVAIVNVSSTEFRAEPYVPFFDWLPHWVAGDNTKLRQWIDTQNISLEMMIFDSAMNIFRKLSREYGMKRTITATNCLTGKDVTLLADIPEYFPTKDLPSNYHYIGPLTWKSNDPPPTWWPPKKGDKPLIYITMGTTGIGSFFPEVYKLVIESDMAAIITTGAQFSSLPTIGNKIYVEPFLNGDLALQECDLVICHGGNGTIYQALQQGKPIIGIPTIPDQKFNMRRVEKLGVGKMLSWKSFLSNPSSLIDLVNAVLDSKSYTATALSFEKLLKQWTAPTVAADIIEQTCCKR